MPAPAVTAALARVGRAWAASSQGQRRGRGGCSLIAAGLGCVGCLLVPAALGLAAVGAVGAAISGGTPCYPGATGSGCGGGAGPEAPISCGGLWVSQGFGDTPWEHPHRGIDLVCPPRTPVRAVVAGIFRRRSDLSGPCPFFPARRGGYGLYGILTGGDGIQYVYGHLDAYAAADSAYVGTGDVLGYEGSTGCSSGYHLHFEVRAGGLAVNPCPYLPPGYPDRHEGDGRCWGSALP